MTNQETIDAIKRALKRAHEHGKPPKSIVRAEEDENGVVMAYDEDGTMVMFCSRKSWDETRRALGVTILDPVPARRAE